MVGVMDNVWNDMDEMIGKVLAGEGSAQEEEKVIQWTQLHEDNRKYYEQLKTIFEKAASAEIQVQFDTDAAWNKVRKKITVESGNVVPLYKERSFLNQPLRIAAGIIILLGWDMQLINGLPRLFKRSPLLQIKLQKQIRCPMVVRLS
ncbi:MAG: hypothetical protein IPJ20_02310 [Flammeovirgaceae bacterium]|nr:hypothetical protein [Flammeovirgaceae bacterium]